MADIYIAYNDDPTHSERVRFESWDEFFAETSAEEIDARVMYGLSADDELLRADYLTRAWILEAYEEYLSEIDDEKRAEAAHRSAHMSETL